MLARLADPDSDYRPKKKAGFVPVLIRAAKRLQIWQEWVILLEEPVYC